METQDNTSPVLAYVILDTHTQNECGRYSADKRHLAKRKADKLDMAYGAVRYVVRPICS
jgi:hypothetical protein